MNNRFRDPAFLRYRAAVSANSLRACAREEAAAGRDAYARVLRANAWQLVRSAPAREDRA